VDPHGRRARGDVVGFAGRCEGKRLEHRLAATAAGGAQMLVLPEFACAQWLSFAPATLPPSAILGWLAETGTVALVAMAELSRRYGVSLLPGTIPHPAGADDADRGLELDGAGAGAGEDSGVAGDHVRLGRDEDEIEVQLAEARPERGELGIDADRDGEPQAVPGMTLISVPGRVTPMAPWDSIGVMESLS
jgi:hypothetical protein